VLDEEDIAGAIQNRRPHPERHSPRHAKVKKKQRHEESAQKLPDRHLAQDHIGLSMKTIWLDSRLFGFRRAFDCIAGFAWLISRAKILFGWIFSVGKAISHKEQRRNGSNPDSLSC
jgi:hypothetical protein